MEVLSQQDLITLMSGPDTVRGISSSAPHGQYQKKSRLIFFTSPRSSPSQPAENFLAPG